LIDRESLKAFARIGFFIGGLGLLLTFIEPRNSPEFVVSVCSAIMGGLLLLFVFIFMRLRK
jgi:hypothetical protein